MLHNFIFFFQIRSSSWALSASSVTPNLLSLRVEDDTTTDAIILEVLVTHRPNPRRDLCAHSVKLSGHIATNDNSRGAVDEERNYALGDTVRCAQDFNT